MGLERKIDGKFDTLTQSIDILIIVAMLLASLALRPHPDERAPKGALRRQGRQNAFPPRSPTSNAPWKEGTPPPPSAASPSGGKAFCLP